MAVIPNVTTHGLMALDVYNKLEPSTVRAAIQKHPRAYLLGSNGPDILFYYKVFPWENQTSNQEVAALGNLVHTKHVNDFYNKAFELITEMAPGERKDVLIAYLAGHLMHWSLDALAHPFVFYRSGEIANDTKYWHFRYESMLDALMITYVKGKSLHDVNVQKFVNVSTDERRYISTFYSYILETVFDEVIDPKIIDDAIVSMKHILKFLYDPHGVVTPVIKKVEKEPWQFSSHIVNGDIDAQFDVLNLKKDVWSNPTDFEDVSNASFIELYDASIELGETLLEAFELILSEQRHTLDDIIQNRQYDTGREVGIEMLYYDSIYEK